MAEFNISLYVTEALYDETGEVAIDRAETYIEGAIRSFSNHSIAIESGHSSISAPTETVDESFTTGGVPCQSNDTDAHWEDLGDWWDAYTQQCGVIGDDAAILITNGRFHSTIGRAYSNFACVCEGGQYLPDLPPSYTARGSGAEFKAINNVLHELGHALLETPVEEHRVYTVYERNGDWGKTAMETGALDPIDENVCGETIRPAAREEIRFSECADDKMGR